MEESFLLNGRANGTIANRLITCNCDVNALRPYIDKRGRSCISVVHNSKLVKVPLTSNADAVLTKDEWIHLDTQVMRIARAPMRAVLDLRTAGLVYSIPNGMGSTVLQTQRMSDAGNAIVSMDAIRRSDADRPVFDLTNLPLPIISSDFSFTAREISTARRGGAPLDTTMAENATRRVMEEAEKFVCGTRDTYTYGGGTIYGYCNYPDAITKTFTDPTDSSWTPATLILEILDMVQKLKDALHFGPYVLYFDDKWGQYLNEDYNSNYPNMTLLQRIRQIEGISDVRMLNFFDDYKATLIQMTSDVVRLVIGMEVVTVQWETEGGMLVNFKVMCIMVPQLRVDKDDNAGLVVASVAA